MVHSVSQSLDGNGVLFSSSAEDHRRPQPGEIECPHGCAPTILPRRTQVDVAFDIANPPTTTFSHARSRVLKRQKEDTPITAGGITGVATAEIATTHATGLAFDTGASVVQVTAPPLVITHTSTNSKPSSTPSAHPTVTSRPAPSMLIGGVIGGLVFLILVLVLGFFYLRRRKTRRIFITPGPPPIKNKSGWKFRVLKKIKQSMQVVTRVPSAYTSSHSRHHDTRYSTTAYPLPHDHDYFPLEGKRERLYQVRREMEEAQLLRQNLQVDLERYGNSVTTDDDATDSSVDDIERLGRQIEEMSGMITALQLELQRLAEEQPPPEYSSTL